MGEPLDERGKEVQREWLKAHWNHEADKLVAYEHRTRADRQAAQQK